MHFADIVALGDRHVRRFADRLATFRGMDQAKFPPVAYVAVYQQAEIEMLKRVVEELVNRVDLGHKVSFVLTEIAGTDPMKDTIPPVRFTHERDFHDFAQRTRELLWSLGVPGQNATPSFDVEVRHIAKRLFGRDGIGLGPLKDNAAVPDDPKDDVDRYRRADDAVPPLKIRSAERDDDGDESWHRRNPHSI